MRAALELQPRRTVSCEGAFSRVISLKRMGHCAWGRRRYPSAPFEVSLCSEPNVRSRGRPMVQVSPQP